MKKVILSMPSSGSDWFADCWRVQENVFHKEFFNPITNPIPNVVDAFGCEMVSHYKKIVNPGDMGPAIQDFIASEWTMTKEVWVLDPLPFLEAGLEVTVFLRMAQNTFPPSRVRVYSWYDAIMHSFGNTLVHKDRTMTAHYAHNLMQTRLLEAAKRYKLPVIWWEDCFSDDVIDEYLPALVAQRIRETRTQRPE
jgi:hypothetical protein